MEPLSIATSLAKVSDVIQETARADRLTQAVENNSVEPVVIPAAHEGLRLLDAGFDPSKFEIGREYAGVMKGVQDAKSRIVDFLRESQVCETIDHFQKKGAELTGDLLDSSGLKEPLELGLQKALDVLASVDWKKLVFIDTSTRLPLPFDGQDLSHLLPETGGDVIKVDQLSDRLNDAVADISETSPHVMCSPRELRVGFSFDDIARFEQEALRWCDEREWLLTAKRVDYVAGSEYVGGIATDLPLLGNMTDICCKRQLGVEVTAEDVVAATVDVAMIVTLAASPFLLPATAVGLGASEFALACAAQGAALGAVHSGLNNGLAAYAKTQDVGQALHQAGVGALYGGILGAIGGASSGAVLNYLGASAAGWVASGAAGGIGPGAIGKAVQVYGATGDLLETIEAAAEGALEGASIGVGLGGAAYAWGRLADTIRPLPSLPEGFPTPEGLMVRVPRLPDSSIGYGNKEVVLGMHRHHIKPLSLGGTDAPENIMLMPKSIHAQPHPTREVLKSPVGTLFYNP